MRGQQKLFNNLLFPASAEEESERIPRNYYSPQRNELLVYRYYFWSSINKKNFVECLNELEQDIHLRSNTIEKILNSCYGTLSQVFNDKPSRDDLKKKFPRMNWNLS